MKISDVVANEMLILNI